VNNKLIIYAVFLVSIIVVTFMRFDRKERLIMKHLVTSYEDGTFSQGDSPHYIAAVEYYRGNIDKSELVQPFSYRPLIPIIASVMPIKSPMTAINYVNLAVLLLSAIFLYKLLLYMQFSSMWSFWGGMLYIFSFPVAYYGAVGIIDTAGIMFIIIGLYYLFRNNYWGLVIAVFLGAFAKETVVIIIPVAFIYYLISKDKNWFWKSAMLTITFIAPSYLLRLYFDTGVGYVWQPALHTFYENLRPKAILSQIIGFGLPGILMLLFIINWKRLSKKINQERLWALFSGVILSIMLVGYSFITAYSDGRFIWHLYPFAIPLGIKYLESKFES
jgi:hypothetical protein